MTDDEMKGEMVIAAGGESLHVKNLSPAIYQALYREVVGKRDVQRNNYTGNFIVKPGDIKNLTERLAHTFSQYDCKATNVSMSVAHHNNEEITFNNLQSFLLYDSVKPDPIKQIEIDFDCVIQRPGSQKKDNYSVLVIVPSYLNKRESEPFVLQIEMDGELIGQQGIKTRVEFVSVPIARAIISTIEEWTRTLSLVEASKMRATFDAYFWKVKSGLVAIGAVATLFGVATLGEKYFSAVSIDYKMAIIGSAAIIGYSVSNLAMNFAGRAFTPNRNYMFVLLNGGDEKNFNNFKSRRERAFRISSQIFASYFLYVLGGLTLRYLLKWFGF